MSHFFYICVRPFFSPIDRIHRLCQFLGQHAQARAPQMAQPAHYADSRAALAPNKFKEFI